MLRAILKKMICPDKCIICSQLLEEPSKTYTCSKCAVHLLERDVCDRCGKPYAFQEKICLYCKEEPLRLVCVKALFPYDEHYKESIQRWKYKGMRKYAKGYGAWMVESWIDILSEEIDGFVPIPISKRRYQRRGFNQALDLANQLYNATGIPVYDVLERCRETKPQSSCKKEERTRNIRGAIKVKEDFYLQESVTLAFIDDIYTTGSTVRECIYMLEKAGIKLNKVYVLVVGLAM